MATLSTKALVASADSRAKRSDGVTLVAAFGDQKPDQFIQLLSDLVERCEAETRLTGWIRLYPKAQIHATIVGLEGKRHDGSIVQENMSARLGGVGPGPPMNFAAFLKFFASYVFDVPMVVGGFGQDDVNPFDLNAGRNPFQRSFDIRSDGLLVAMGWPQAVGKFTPYMIGLRKYLETFNVVHKYHVRLQDQDNDLFFVVGEVDASRWGSASDSEREIVQEALNELVTDCQQHLSGRRYAFSLQTSDLYIVRYLRTSLEETSFVRPVTQTDVNTLVDLYP
jgi:hypothetical protein